MTLRTGISVEGLAKGTAWLLVRRQKGASCNQESLDMAFRRARSRLEGLVEKGSGAEIFAAHLEMLDDPLLRETIEANVNDGMDLSEAMETASRQLSAMLSDLDDEYLRARADDIRDVCSGLIKSLSEDEANPFDGIPEDAVIVAEELFPSDTAAMDLNKVRAFVTRRGSATSHACIIARSRGIPVVLGTDIGKIKDGDTLIVDGDKAEVHINPDEGKAISILSRNEKWDVRIREVRLALHESGIKVCGNAGSVSDIEACLSSGAEGIGLFRTEFLFMSGDRPPGEDEQYEAYTKALAACKGKTLTIRTMDIGGDKMVPYLELPHEDNPFLGMRAVRLSLSRPDLFKTQIRAILRAGANGKARLMLPMVTTLEEVRQTKRCIEQCKAELDHECIPFDRNIQIGIMVETPSAAIISDILAPEVDFFSIGTNDLTQFIMAADRGNNSVSYLYDPMAPAVTRSLKMIADSAHKAGIPVGVCGEMAADLDALEMLCRIGVDSISLTSPTLIERLKRRGQ